MFDLKITGGTVVDGTGAERYRADVGIKDGQIVDVVRRGAEDAEIGGSSSPAAETIDATGQVVAPASSTSTPTTTVRSPGTVCWSRPAATVSRRW